MKKRILSLLLAIIMIVGTIPTVSFTASAAVTTGSCGTNATYTLDDESGALVISGTGAINASAFANKTAITSVVIGEGITSIGDSAFNYCTNIKSIKFPSTLESIGSKAFYMCGNNGSGIKTLSIPSSVKSIGNQAFYNIGRYNTHLTIHANDALSIGNYAFDLESGSIISFAGTKPATLGTRSFNSGTTVYLPTNYNGGTATEFGSATVNMIAEADAEASVTFSNGVVINYETLQTAFNAASGNSGATIKLLKNIDDLSKSVSLHGPADVTFDLNGKNITMNNNRYICVNGNGAKLTMTGTGKITYNHNATEVPTGASAALYAPVKVKSGQNDIDSAELVIGGNVIIEATDDLTAAVAIGANDPPAPAKLTVKDNAKLISNNASYIISYDSPVSTNRWGNCDIFIEGGTFENKQNGNVIGYDDTLYDNPDELYHAYIALDGIKVDSKLKNVYYLIDNDLPAATGTVTYGSKAINQGGKYYVKAGDTAALAVSGVQSGVTLNAQLGDTLLSSNEGTYSFTMPASPAKVKFTVQGASAPEVYWGTAADSLTKSGTWEEFKTALNSYYSGTGEEVSYAKLGKDIIVTTDIIPQKVLVFDINGKNVTATTQMFSCTMTCDLTIKDSADNDGTITRTTEGKIIGGTRIGDGKATVKIEGGKFVATGEYSIVLWIETGDTFTISGGEFKSEETMCTIWNYGTLIVSGGTVHSGTGGAIRNAFSGTLILTEGTILGTEYNLQYHSGLIDLSGHQDPTGIKIAISTPEGSVTLSDTTIKLPTGYGLFDSSNNAVTELKNSRTYTVGIIPTYVASVTTASGTTNYTDIAVALAAAEEANGSTLKLLDNITSEGHFINSGKFTIDLNGKIWEYAGTVFTLDYTTDVKITDTSASASGKILSTSNASTILMKNTANLEIAGGTVENNGSVSAISLNFAGSSTDATLTVSSGNIVTNGTYAILAYGKSVTITGGTLESPVSHISYLAGVLDLSGHSDPAGIKIYCSPNSSVTSSSLKLPSGYALRDQNNDIVTTLVAGDSFTVVKNEFTVSFVDHDGTPISSVTVAYGEDATAPAAPTREGYKFTGWDVSYSNVTGNITVTAQYTEKASITIDSSVQTVIFTSSYKQFEIRGTTLTGFDVKYKQGGVYMSPSPFAVGTYDVVITRAEDDNYKRFETTITGGLVIEYLDFDMNALDISGYDDGSIKWTNGSESVLVNVAVGYQISKIYYDAYANSVSLVDGDALTVYVKRDSDGGITDAIDLSSLISFDSVAPTGKVELDTNNFWETLINKVTFGLFFKDNKTVTITATDAESGVKEVLYYVSEEDLIDNDSSPTTKLESAIGTGWNTYNGPLTLSVASTNIVYVRITDNVGNVTYISSDGIVIYAESTTSTTSLKYTKKSAVDPAFNISLNSNTIKEVRIGSTVLTKDVDYTVTVNGDVATVALTASKLDAVTAGDHTVVVDLYPNGVVTDDVNSTISVDLTILKASVTAPTIESKVYTGSTLTADVAASDLYKVSNNAGGINVGDYDVVLTLKDPETYKWGDNDTDTTVISFTIIKADVTITAEDKTVEQYVDFPVFTYKVEGLLVNDGVATGPKFSLTIDNTKVFGKYDITVSDAVISDNYNITYVKGALTITEHTQCRGGYALCTVAATCNICKSYYGSAIGHSWVKGSVDKEATCTQSGTQIYICRNNEQHKLTKEIPATGHEWDDGVITTEPTCNTEGIKTYTCKKDNNHTNTESVAIDANAHVWNKGVITTEPTCTQSGVKTYTCENDSSHTKTENVSATGHAWKDATTEQPKTCENCETTEGEPLAPETNSPSVSGDTPDTSNDEVSDTDQIDTPKDTDADKKLGTGTVVGITIGSLSLLALIAFLIFWMIRKKKED